MTSLRPIGFFEYQPINMYDCEFLFMAWDENGDEGVKKHTPSTTLMATLGDAWRQILEALIN